MAQELTYGEKAVGLTFNPGGNEAVTAMKQRYARAIDELNDMRARASSPEHARLCSDAITEAQTAQMWAVKALTWSD